MLFSCEVALAASLRAVEKMLISFLCHLPHIFVNQKSNSGPPEVNGNIDIDFEMAKNLA